MANELYVRTCHLMTATASVISLRRCKRLNDFIADDFDASYIHLWQW